jgi:hypothetical protein
MPNIGPSNSAPIDCAERDYAKCRCRTKLDLGSVEVCTSVGVAQRAGKAPEGFLAGTDSSSHCPYRRLYAAAEGNRFRAWVGNLLGHLGTEVGNLLGRLGTRLLGDYLVIDSPVVPPTNPSMGLRPANTTSSASYRAALGDTASIAGTVLS